MKKILNLVYGSIFAVCGFISVVMFAQNYVNFELNGDIQSIKNFENVYLTVCILMGICAASSFIYLIINIFSIRLITLINSIIGLVISIIIASMCGIYYGFLQTTITLPFDSIKKAAEFLPLILIGTTAIPATVSFCSIFRIKNKK